MGAGFTIAMRDLEIRGAGNILGTQQSGHIAAVGYELYCQLLEKAVQQLKQQPLKQPIEVDVDLPGEGHIPRSYVPDMRLKIDLYRRLGADFQRRGAARSAQRAARPLRHAAAAGRTSALAGRTADGRPSLADRIDPPGAAVRGLPLSVGPADPRTGRPKWGQAAGRR